MPNEFVPERFLGSSMDIVMYGCPGKAYAVAVVEKMLANLLCKFDLTLPNGVKLKDLDMGETFGLAI
ncbi:(+)-menthofuran synthase-like protein [Tanacetum coccineum]